MSRPSPDPDASKELAGGRFDKTRTSLLLRVRGEGSDATRALNDLCEIYWPPIYSYVCSRGYQPADAKNLVQDFFVRVVAGDLFGRADREKGKLRVFLVSCLKDHLATEHRKGAAKKRGGGIEHVSLDLPDEERCFPEPSDNRTPEEEFDVEWAILLLRRAIKAVRDGYKKRGKQKLFDALSPFLIDSLDAAQTARLASKFDLEQNNIKQIRHRMSCEFDQALLREVQETVSSAKDDEEELAAIRAVLRRALLKLQ